MHPSFVQYPPESIILKKYVSILPFAKVSEDLSLPMTPAGKGAKQKQKYNIT